MKHVCTDLLLPAVFGLLSLGVTAQSLPPLNGGCGTGIPSQQWEDEFQKQIADYKSGMEKAKGQQPVLRTIPVIIHVIHGGQNVGQYPNLAQGQLNSQIKVLNDDFGGIGFNSGNYNPQAFVNWAIAKNNNTDPWDDVGTNSMDVFGRVKIANTYVQFCMAQYDTSGNLLAEPGIERINYVSRGWANPAAQNSYNNFKNLIDGVIKPQTIWDPAKYMNIWVTDENLNSVGLLGYATFPPNSTLPGLQSANGTTTTDGYWCYARAFGSVDQFPTGFYTAANNRGRISSHEIGHYLGLRHIWGDGNCANDYCNDTPSATGQNFGAPLYPLKTTGCSGNSPDGEMFMNFMDYVDDPYKYMFTEDQATRIQTAMTYSPLRKYLGTHNLCMVTPIAAVSQFKAPLSICSTSAAVTLTNQSTGTPVPSYTWAVTGGAFINPGPNSPVAAISFPTAGIYTITLTVDNGTVSTSTQVMTVYQPTMSLSGYNSVVCEGSNVLLTASGGNYFTWLPAGIVSPTMGLDAFSGEVTYTVTSVGAGNCKTQTVVSIASMDCTGLTEAEQAVSSAVLQPNPSNGLVKIVYGSEALVMVNLRDVTGKLILSRSVQSGSTELDLTALPQGLYIVELNGGTFTRSLKLIRE